MTIRSFLFLLLLQFAAADTPNILWITSEDNASHWLGCYGNDEAKTPRLDNLAEQGNRYLHAYSNAPVCAVARSTILTGVYAPSQGTQHMRSRYPIPKDFKPYVQYLQESGYYCTNASKTDFNIKGNDKAIWDECSNKAHYKNRKEGQPFFAIFNITVSHESSLFPGKNPSPMMDPATVEVPPYLPDLPEVRRDIASYHNRMNQLDTRIGRILDELEEAGLADDTIVFYYSDHGGATPRGKRYLKETGVNVPLIIRVPEKWQGLSPFKPGKTVDEPVAFVDLAPTLLSLIGEKKPGHMQGRAFLGKHREDSKEGVFLYADRFDELYGMRRGWTDGRWKYIRRFNPHHAAAPYSFYQFSQPAWVAWKKAWQDGELKPEHARIWETPQETEELFDLQADPWEIKNLAADPAHEARLSKMREQLKAKMTEVRDTGIVPEPLFDNYMSDSGIVPAVRADDFGYSEKLDLAFASSNGKDVGRFKNALKSEDPIMRYWALNGMCVANQADGVEALLNDEHSAIRVLAAEALWLAGSKDKAREALFAEVENELNEHSMLNLINTIHRLDLADNIPKTTLEKWRKLADSDRGYVKRFLQRLPKSKK